MKVSRGPTHAQALKALRRHADPKKAATYRGFFKNSKNDIFLGVTTPQMREVSKAFRGLAFPDLRKLMASRVHEERSLAHAVLVWRYAKADEPGKKRIFDFYLANRRFIHDWDGVDDSAPYLVGPHLLRRSRKVLFQLAKSKSLWDRRIAIVSTWWFIRQGDVADTFRLAQKLLKDEQDLIHKAVGWMLREAGKRDLGRLKGFLEKNALKMPRTMLRYAIEKFPEKERKRWLSKTE
ncbi:MAG TPA: DNA alkylation repair protein [bacterium]|nr:DNA alkylation repair protein [bacterium]